MPSSSALWASIGPSIRSPIAEIARHVGLELGIDGDLAGLRIDLHADFFETQPSVYGRRPTATSTLSPSKLERLAVLALGGDRDLASFDLRAGDLGLQVELEPLLGQALGQEVADLAIGQRHDPRQELDDGDLRAQPLPDRAQLQADVAAADDDEMLGHLVEAERLGGADDGLAVERQEGQGDRFAAGRQQDVPGLEVDRCRLRSSATWTVVGRRQSGRCR